MKDLLHDGVAWLADKASDVMASTVKYRRGEAEIEVPATSGRTDYEVEDQSGMKVQAHVVDFLIPASELENEPVPGDVIVKDAVEYEVMNFAGTGCWRWSTAFRHTRRIHTREVGQEESAS